jgi:integrase
MDRYGAFVRILLLTAQRVGKVSAMRWEDISEEGVWTIRSEAREKGNAGELKLPQLALDIIRAQPQVDWNAFIFAGSAYRRRKSADRSIPPDSFGKRRYELEERLGDIEHWTLHDLRRTARSLMARAGVADNIAERTLGHTLGGVHGVYNRHDYFAEKSEALQKLATVIEQIINPPDKTNVVPIAARR